LIEEENVINVVFAPILPTEKDAWKGTLEFIQKKGLFNVPFV